jgi:cation diffusion facilitator CzcD-associated flavoprotein CzcO
MIYGTGFRAADFMFPIDVVGAGGVTLQSGGAQAHLGICVPGFPSLFLMYGPNTNTSGGRGSIVFYEEAQAAYIRQALVEMGSRGAAAVEVRREVETASNSELQARFAGTAWIECNSWYRDQSGRIVANWPGYTTEYAERVRALDPGEFSFTAASSPA